MPQADHRRAARGSEDNRSPLDVVGTVSHRAAQSRVDARPRDSVSPVRCEQGQRAPSHFAARLHSTSSVPINAAAGEQAWARPKDRHRATARPRKRACRDPTDLASQWGCGTTTGGCQAVVFDAVGKVTAAKWTATWVPAAPRVASATARRSTTRKRRAFQGSVLRPRVVA